MAKTLVSQQSGSGFDYDNKRVMFDSMCTFNGRPIIQCGLYDATDDGTAYIRSDTVSIDQFRGQVRVGTDRVIERIEEALKQREQDESEDHCRGY